VKEFRDSLFNNLEKNEITLLLNLLEKVALNVQEQ